MKWKGLKLQNYNLDAKTQNISIHSVHNALKAVNRIDKYKIFTVCVIPSVQTGGRYTI